MDNIKVKSEMSELEEICSLNKDKNPKLKEDKGSILNKDEDDESEAIDLPFECDKCDQTFAKNAKFVAHKNTHNPVRLEHPEARQRPYECDECNKSFTHRVLLTNHKYTHSGIKPFKCNECDKSFSEKSNLRRHKRIHLQDKPFKCDHCDKTFAVKVNLQHHQYIHTGNYPFSCDQCDKKYSYKTGLKYHMWKHTGDRNYYFSCDQCDKKYSYKIDLMFHMRKHTGEQTYECEDCGKGFTRITTLKRHQVTHSTTADTFSCKVCNIKCRRSQHLVSHRSTTKHIENVKNLKPNELKSLDELPSLHCEVCNKIYITKRSLNFHMRMHRKMAAKQTESRSANEPSVLIESIIKIEPDDSDYSGNSVNCGVDIM